MSPRIPNNPPVFTENQAVSGSDEIQLDQQQRLPNSLTNVLPRRARGPHPLQNEFAANIRRNQAAEGATSGHTQLNPPPIAGHTSDVVEKQTALALVQKSRSFSSCLDSPEGRQVHDYLTHQKEITVLVGIANGFGFQASAVTGMRRLQELGFKGRFAVLVEGDNKFARQKFEFLAKSYQKTIKFNIYNAKNPPPANELGMTFACDDYDKWDTADRFAKECNTKNFIHLSTTGWKGGHQQVYANGRLQEFSPEVLENGILECGSGDAASHEGEVSRQVKSIIKAKEKKGMKVVVKYELHDWPSNVRDRESASPEKIGLRGEEELSLLVESLLQHQQEPILLCVVGKLPDLPKNLIGSPRFGKVFDPAFLGKPARGDVKLLHLKHVDNLSFDYLEQHCDLAIGEGAKFLASAKKFGTPFLVGGRNYLQKLPIDEAFMENSDFANASTALTAAIDPPETQGTRAAPPPPSREQRLKDLSTYYEKCLSGKLRSFYDDWSEAFLSLPCKTFEGVRMVLPVTPEN